MPYAFQVVYDVYPSGIDRNEHRNVLLGHETHQTVHRLLDLPFEESRTAKTNNQRSFDQTLKLPNQPVERQRPTELQILPHQLPVGGGGRDPLELLEQAHFSGILRADREPSPSGTLPNVHRKKFGLLLSEVMGRVNLGVVRAQLDPRLHPSEHYVVSHLAGVPALEDVLLRFFVKKLQDLLIPFRKEINLARVKGRFGSLDFLLQVLRVEDVPLEHEHRLVPLLLVVRTVRVLFQERLPGSPDFVRFVGWSQLELWKCSRFLREFFRARDSGYLTASCTSKARKPERTACSNLILRSSSLIGILDRM